MAARFFIVVNGVSVQFAYDDEQLALIGCNDRIVVGEAFAGSGKTTTAIGYCEYRPHERILYLCLTKANQLEAKSRFPKSVTCLTSHALAYKSMSSSQKGRVIKAWKARHVAEELGVHARVAAAVRAVILAFLADGSESIAVGHVLRVAKSYEMDSTAQRRELYELAQTLWRRMCDPDGTAVMPHDAYLKQWALSRPQLDYDAIIVDEAQDTNPITSYVVIHQAKARVVLIGDRHQSIYAFRGASNAMEYFSKAGATVIKLTNSWRFGQRTAMLANALLDTYKGERVRIQGRGTDAHYEAGQAIAYLARTNAHLFELAVSTQGQGVYWIGGAANYRIDLILDAYRLYSGNLHEINDPFLRRYASWEKFVEETKMTKDQESVILIRIVTQFTDDVPELIESILFHEETDLNNAKIVLGTAHKAKGFEFPFVRVCEDFVTYEILKRRLLKINFLDEATKQEVNLLYVAITRATKKVVLNEDAKELFADISRGCAIKPSVYV